VKVAWGLMVPRIWNGELWGKAMDQTATATRALTEPEILCTVAGSGRYQNEVSRCAGTGVERSLRQFHWAGGSFVQAGGGAPSG
jgi:hypothetical protein